MGSRLEKTVEDGQQASEQLLVNLLFYDDATDLTEEEAQQAAEAMSDSEKAAYFRDKFTNDPKLVFTALNYGTPNRASRSSLFIWGFVDGHVVSPVIDWDPKGGNYFPKPMIIGDTKSVMNRVTTMVFHFLNVIISTWGHSTAMILHLCTTGMILKGLTGLTPGPGCSLLMMIIMPAEKPWLKR